MVRRHTPYLGRAYILASASPRRRELLTGLGITFRVMPPEIDETAIAGTTPADTARRLAEAKATEVMGQVGPSGEIIVAADTVVVLDGEILGKPADAEEAVRMLKRLSGRTHTVITGITVWDAATGQGLSEVETTAVEFRRLADREIEAYVATGDPLDKAGAYGVQTGNLVREVRGSLSNVAGLPMEKLLWLIQRLDA
ncbi:MAG: Maf family protein [Planctomycetes bacterium]|nr:Maf family protein [Planctomycetota bacterium]